MVQQLLSGGLAGLVATLPMTVFMESAHRELPKEERYPLPPRLITDRLAEESGVDPMLDEEDRQKLTLLSHFAYGAAGGALFAPLVHNTSLPRITTGIAFGLAVWTGSYLGWLPAVNILPSATHHPARRNALMIGAHVVYGAALGKLLGMFSPQRY